MNSRDLGSELLQEQVLDPESFMKQTLIESFANDVLKIYGDPDLRQPNKLVASIHFREGVFPNVTGETFLKVEGYKGENGPEYVVGIIDASIAFNLYSVPRNGQHASMGLEEDDPTPAVLGYAEVEDTLKDYTKAIQRGDAVYIGQAT